MSDHGFHACTRAMHMDKLLQSLGYLEFTASQAWLGRIQAGRMRGIARRVYDLFGLHGKVSLPQPVNWAKTRVYTSIRSTGEGVSVNLAGREPNGIVDPADFERVRDEVAERLGAWTDPKTGRRPIARIRRREEVFSGDRLDHAPDLLLEPTPGFSLTHAKSVIEDAGWAAGDHRVEGVIAATGPRVAREAFAESPGLIDLAPTILAAVDARGRGQARRPGAHRDRRDRGGGARRRRDLGRGHHGRRRSGRHRSRGDGGTPARPGLPGVDG